jgi:hypothetical protein
MKRLILSVLVCGVAAGGFAEVMDRPGGIRIGTRMTLRPYVSLYHTYDSNTYGYKDSGSASSWSVMPGATLEYLDDNWKVDGGAYYNYRAYTKHPTYKNQHNFGQNLGVTWTNAEKGGRGWTLLIRESFAKITEDNDMTAGGRGIGRDRIQAQVSGVLERRFTEAWHANVNASYYYLDYDNDDIKYGALYGWTRWTVGSQIGYTASKWTDIIFAANYQGYTQDNNYNRDGIGLAGKNGISADSEGWTIHAGIATHATERITYRLTGGWSFFEYGGGTCDADGFTYTASMNWSMADRWNMMFLATSYFQPGETTYGSLNRTDSVSWGIGHAMVRGKLNATFDIAYRHQEREYTAYALNDYDEDIFSTRFGLNYTLNRFASIFGNIEYQFCDTEGRSYDDRYDYDRLRVTVGMRLTY